MIGFDDGSNHSETRSMLRSIGMMDRYSRTYVPTLKITMRLADEMEGLLT